MKSGARGKPLAALIVAIGVLAAGCSSRGAGDDAVDEPPTSTSAAVETPATSADSPTTTSPTALGDAVRISPGLRVAVLRHVDNALAALRADDFEAAARTWRPGGATEAEARELLAVACAEGCLAQAEVIAVRSVGGTSDAPMMEALIRTVDGDWAVSATIDDGLWLVTSDVPTPLVGPASATVLDDLASVLTSNGGELVIARQGAAEVWVDGTHSWTPHPLMDQGVQGRVRDWIFAEGSLVSVAEPEVVCSYPATAPDARSVVANLADEVDGRLLVQVQAGGSFDEPLMVDCETGAFVDVAPLITPGSDGEWTRTLTAGPSSVVLQGDAEGNARIHGPTGSPLSDDYTSEARLDATGTWVAYLDHTSGREGGADHHFTRRVMVRAVADGSLVGEWVLEGLAHGGPLWIGEHLVVSSGPGLADEDATPQLTAINVPTGELQTIHSPAHVAATSG